MKLTTKRELLYGGPLHLGDEKGGKSYHYVAYFGNEKVGDGETKEEAEANGVRRIMGALASVNNSSYASITADGHPVTTREYLPGQVEFVHHRSANGSGGSMMSQLEIDGKRVSAREFHQHYLAMYNEAVKPTVDETWVVRLPEDC